MHHREHLYLAWSLLRQYDQEEALQQVKERIFLWAAQHERALLYHETLTRFWVRMVALAMKQHPDLTDFEEFLATCPHLLDKNLPFRYWSQATFWSEAARAQWVEPDRSPLPEKQPQEIEGHPEHAE